MSQKRQNGILYDLEEYPKLVDYTGPLWHLNKKGAISELLRPILQGLNPSSKEWHDQPLNMKRVIKNSSLNQDWLKIHDINEPQFTLITANYFDVAGPY